MLVVFFLFAFFMIESYEVRNGELWSKSLHELIMYVLLLEWFFELCFISYN